MEEESRRHLYGHWPRANEKEEYDDDWDYDDDLGFPSQYHSTYSPFSFTHPTPTLYKLSNWERR
jgi:hypothetical protein